MAWWVKALRAKPDDWCVISGPYVLKGDQLLQGILTPHSSTVMRVLGNISVRSVTFVYAVFV